jgi:hypothetical protein
VASHCLVVGAHDDGHDHIEKAEKNDEEEAAGKMGRESAGGDIKGALETAHMMFSLPAAKSFTLNFSRLFPAPPCFNPVWDIVRQP